MSKLSERLARLLALATPQDDDDDARTNECRTAAYLLLRECAKNGVKVRFVLPAETASPIHRQYAPPTSDPLIEWLKRQDRAQRRRERAQKRRDRAPAPADDDDSATISRTVTGDDWLCGTSVCWHCGGPFRPGEQATKAPRKAWVHAECDERPTQERAKRAPFVVDAGEFVGFTFTPPRRKR